MAVQVNNKTDEAAIPRLLDQRIRALHDKNIEGVMALYAPDVVTFDIVPPLRYVGAESFRKLWVQVFSAVQSPIGHELHDLNIMAGGDVAFTHSLNQKNGIITNGQKTDVWLRWTACFRQIDDQWLIVYTRTRYLSIW